MNRPTISGVLRLLISETLLNLKSNARLRTERSRVREWGQIGEYGEGDVRETR